MAIPKNISREHIEKAIQEINPESIPSQRKEQHYSLVENGKSLPPKYVISIANRIANGAELGSDDFNAVEAKEYLIKLSFNIVDKRTKQDKETMNIWIEKTIVAGREDRLAGERQLGKVLWSPQKGKPNKNTGTMADVYKNMRLVEKGDIILHLIDNQKFAGISISEDTAHEAVGLPGTEWEGPAYLIKLENYTELTPNLDRSEFLNEKYKDTLKEISKLSEVFYNDNLDLRQGAYLTPCPIKLLKILNTIYKQKSGTDLPFINTINFPMDITTSFNTFKYLKHCLSIKTKPFIILAGISGTGKSRLVRTLAYKTCSKEELRNDTKKPGNFELIPVRPNWHDSSELMGYVSRISGEKYITTSFLKFIAKAWKNIDTPFFLCLDEMNIAPVEQYFAEYLSIIETRQVQNTVVVTDFLISKSSFENKKLYNELLTDLGLNDDLLFADGIGIPNNLVVIGTVNMDETTHSFSRKVLDRAMTFEMNNIDLTAGLDDTKNDWSYPKEFIKTNELIGEYTSGAEVVNKFAESKIVIDFLQNINNELEGTPFKIAYRVRDEFLIYCYYASLNSADTNWLRNALDEMTSMKILSRIEGDETKTGSVLSNLQRVLTIDFNKSNAKLKEMETRLQSSGYTSFWS